jgi:hypothetical protein
VRLYYSGLETVRRTLKTLWDTRSLTATLLAYKFNASYRRAFFQSDHFQRFRGPHQRLGAVKYLRGPPEGTAQTGAAAGALLQ